MGQTCTSLSCTNHQPVTKKSLGSQRTNNNLNNNSQQHHHHHLFPNSIAPEGSFKSVRTIQINDILLNHDARQKFADYVKKEKEIDFASPSIEEIEECYPYVQELLNSYITSRHADDIHGHHNSTNTLLTDNQTKKDASTTPSDMNNESKSSTLPDCQLSSMTSPEEAAKLTNEFVMLLTLQNLPNYNEALTRSTDETIAMQQQSSRKT